MDSATATISPSGDAVRIHIANAADEAGTAPATKPSEKEPQITTAPQIDIFPMASGLSRIGNAIQEHVISPIRRQVPAMPSASLPASLPHFHSFNNREMFCYGFTAVLGIVALSLIISVAVDHSHVFANILSPKQPIGDICLDYNCYKSSATMQRSMNTSVSPCDNFYQYACGGWIASQTLSAEEQERTVLKRLMKENIHRLKDVILEDLDFYRDTNWAYEKKVQLYYKTCINQFQSTLVSIIANPLLDEIHKMGSWYVLGPYTTYNRTRAHANVLGHDNLIDVFFYWDIEPLDQQHLHHFITIREDWMLPLPYRMWTRTEMVNPYRQFVRKVAEMLAADEGVHDDQLSFRLDTFVDDVTAVERALAAIHRSNQNEIVNPRNGVKTIAQLQQSYPAFRWLYYFRAILSEADGSVLNSRTVAIIRTPKILKAVSDLLQGSTFTRRQIHNYLVWRLVYGRLPEMPYRYNHLWLDWSEKVKGRSFQYQPIWSVCFNRLVRYMSDAVGGLFVRKHFTHYDKNELQMMVETTRTSIINEVSKLPWMDEYTKGNATEKLYHVIEKIGFPDHMDSELNMQNALDYLYMEVEMSDSDHFANAQQLRQHFRKQMVQIFNDGRDWYSDWRETPLYSTKATYFYPWNEMIVPAGMLQFPIYSAINPHMYRSQMFGATAVRLARAFILSIDETGSWFSKWGDFPDDWWSNNTYYSYLPRKKCISDTYAKIQTKPIAFEGEPQPRKLDDADTYALKAIVEIGALRNAYTAYKSELVQSDPWTKQEPMIPGVAAKLHDEYFFLSYAQSSCAVRTDEYTALNMAIAHWLPEELALNNALKQLKEFSDVFQCPVGSPMNPSDRCEAIF